MSWENNDVIWARAREVMPLPRLMQVLGDGVYAQKRPPGCPFCEQKTFNLWNDRGGRDHFKCWSGGCPANEPENDSEIGYLMLRRGLNKKDAAKEYLRLAVPDAVPHLFEDHAAPAFGAEPQKRKRPDGPREGAAKSAWHSLWKKLPLTVEDRALLRKKRGLDDETIDAIGFRSNNASNQMALEQLLSEYPMDLLLDLGIYNENSGRPKPSGQFRGMGITDKKDPKTGKNVFELTEPIIIPYQDASGLPFYLRPHKGGVKGRMEIFEDVQLFDDDLDPEPEVCAAHVFSPYLLSELISINDGACIFTEGEFKAAALMQCGFAAIACPGISFIRNGKFRRELLELLKKFGVRHMTILFDNEEKDNPAYPKRYKENPQKRWDTVVYAEYTCIDTKGYFDSVDGSCRIGKLPDEFREEGKADCDGILAKMVEKYGIEQGTKAAARIFQDCVTESSEKPGLDLFPTECRRVVERSLMRMFYKPKTVFAAGWKEMELARRFSEISEEGLIVDSQLATIFRSLRGCYYKRGKTNADELKVLNVEKNSIQTEIEKIKASKPLSEEDHRNLSWHYGRLASIWERIKGMPEDISDFQLSCEYKIHTEHGEVQRLVRIHDSKDSRSKSHVPEEKEKMNYNGLRKLTPGDMARLADFRKWCYATGKGTWKGGDKELQVLVQQMDHRSFLCDIHEVSSYGWHRKSDIWFFGDVAYHDGKTIPADDAGIFWHDGIGYQIEAASSDGIGQSFAQGAPLLLKPHNSAPLENASVVDVFAVFCNDMYLTIGGYEGWLAIGNVLAYAITPELLREFGGHPGLWMSGLLSSGKTSIARWFCRIWGFKELGGIRLDDTTTHTAMNRFLAQYSSTIVWFDEYRQGNDDPQKESVLRGAFDRSSGAKGMPDGSNKTRNASTFTTPMVTGESSSRDAATRSRYVNINISLHNRIGDGTARFPRIQNDSEHYYLLGRWLMENRTEFVKKCMEALRRWMETKHVKESIPNARTRVVYGVSYATFSTMASMLGLERSIIPRDGAVGETQEARRRFAAAMLVEYEHFLVKHGESALQDVQDETFLSQFWRDIIDGLTRHAIKAKFFLVDFVKAKEDGVLEHCDPNDHEARRVVYINPDPAFSEYQKDKASRREEIRMSINNIRRDLEKQPYWVPPPKGKNMRSHRKSMDGARPTCWVIDVTESENGECKAGFAQDLLNAIPAANGGDKKQTTSGDDEH